MISIGGKGYGWDSHGKMEIWMRLLIYLTLGLFLLGANLWFFSSVRDALGGGSYIVRPFVIINEAGQESSERAGLAMAQMAVSRLATVQDRLRGAPPMEGGAQQDDPRGSVTRLFVPRQVDIPASLIEPVDIRATVAGVELGGVIAWLRRLFSQSRALRFTVYQRADRAVISADLGGFSGTTRHIWFESGGDPDEIATNVAYALLWLKLRENPSNRIAELDIAQFRALLETLIAVDSLNRQVARGHLVDTRFLDLLPRVEAQLRETPRWPELLYLAGSIADGAANAARAASYYRALVDLSEAERAGASDAIFRTARERLQHLSPAAADISQEDRIRFTLAASEFARLLALPDPDPQIAFVPQQAGLQAVWNTEADRYEVNPAALNTEGLPQYVALMGRFMARNFDRCFGDPGRPAPTVEFWNGFRYSVVDYLIRSEPRFRNVVSFAGDQPLYRALRQIEERSGAEASRRLALELLQRFECDWTPATLADQMLRINRERGLMADATISEAMAAFAPQPAPPPAGGRRTRRTR